MGAVVIYRPVKDRVVVVVEVPAVDVIDITIVVVVDVIAVDLKGIDPDVVDEVGMVNLDAFVDHTDDDI